MHASKQAFQFVNRGLQLTFALNKTHSQSDYYMISEEDVSESGHGMKKMRTPSLKTDTDVLIFKCSIYPKNFLKNPPDLDGGVFGLEGGTLLFLARILSRF